MAGICYLLILLIIYTSFWGVKVIPPETAAYLMTLPAMILALIALKDEKSPAAVLLLILVMTYVIRGSHFPEILAICGGHINSSPHMKLLESLRETFFYVPFVMGIPLAVKDIIFAFRTRSSGPGETGEETPEEKGGPENPDENRGLVVVARMVIIIFFATVLLEEIVGWRVEALYGREKHLEWIRIPRTSPVWDEVRECAFEVKNDSFLVDYRGSFDGGILIRCRDGSKMMLDPHMVKIETSAGRRDT